MTIPYVKRFILPFPVRYLHFFSGIVRRGVAFDVAFRQIPEDRARTVPDTGPPLWKFRVTGREYIDRRKPYVIVVNHQAGLDIPTLYFVPLNFRWVSKREVFKVPFFGQFLLLHGDICINRGHATAAMEKVIRDGKLWLSRGASVAIFPEGTRSHDGEIYRFKAGAFTLAREAGVEILPVVLDGTTTMIGRNGMFNWRNKLTVSILPPVSAERVAAADPKELMEQVRASMCVRLAEIRKQK